MGRSINVFDIAKYILEKQGSMTTMKLQKLVYYCQAWSLVWDEKPLFPEKIQAWASGPVAPELYDIHRGKFKIDSLSVDDKGRLRKYERETIDAVLKFYGNKSSQWLSDLSHLEKPWNDVRVGYEVGVHCENEITLALMAEYYGSL